MKYLIFLLAPVLFAPISFGEAKLKGNDKYLQDINKGFFEWSSDTSVLFQRAASTKRNNLYNPDSYMNFYNVKVFENNSCFFRLRDRKGRKSNITIAHNTYVRTEDVKGTLITTEKGRKYNISHVLCAPIGKDKLRVRFDMAYGYGLASLASLACRLDRSQFKSCKDIKISDINKIIPDAPFKIVSKKSR